MSEVFHADNKKIKKTILGTGLFIMVAFFVCGIIGKHTWHGTIFNSLIFSAIFLMTFLTYAHCAILGRSYLVSTEGITLLKNNSSHKHIPWNQLKGLSKGYLVAPSKENVKISFNLPPKLQMNAREAIERLHQSKAEADAAPSRRS